MLCYFVLFITFPIYKINSSINQLGFINLYPFFNLYFFSIMKLFSNNRQKLSLHRIRKAFTPQKMSIQVVNGCKIPALQNPLSTQDTNVVKLGNSSIFRKESQKQVEIRQKQQSDLIRCRSISCLDSNGRSNIKLLPSSNKLGSSNLDEKPSNRRLLQQIIHQNYKNTMQVFKQRGILAVKSNFYYINVQTFNDMLEQIGDRIIESIGKADLSLNVDSLTTKESSQGILPQRNETNFQIFNQFSISEAFKKTAKLSYQLSNISLHLQYEHSTKQKKSFWKIMENIGAQRLSEQNFNFLLQKNKYLKQQISTRELELKGVNQKIEQMSRIMELKKSQVAKMDQIMEEKYNCLNQVEKAVRDIEQFINKQPNKILQQQAEGYKQRQQQLFDLAFLLQQSAPSTIAAYVQQSIMIPFKSFKLTLDSFAHALTGQDCYLISPKDMEAFKNSINSAYESTIDKLSSIIEKKASKITHFVGIMRRLASYTIGKRQYLTQINKKMAVVSIQVEKKIKLIQSFLVGANIIGSAVRIIQDLKQLTSNMKSIYCQAEVFY